MGDEDHGDGSPVEQIFCLTCMDDPTKCRCEPDNEEAYATGTTCPSCDDVPAQCECHLPPHWD